MKIQMISSGSKGNSYLITTKKNNNYLIDFGVSISKVKGRSKRNIFCCGHLSFDNYLLSLHL